MATTNNEQLCSSGFKRILLRLDESTRRKYCCRAVEEDLQHMKNQMQACEAAMAEVKQVQDATLKLAANQRAAVSSELLGNLETLQLQLEMSLNKVFQPHNEALNLSKVDKTEATTISKASDDDIVMKTQQAKKLSRQLLETQELETVVTGIRHLQRLMPVLKKVDERKKTRWKKYVLKVVAHAVELLKGEDRESKWVLQLEKTLKKIENKDPELKMWHSNMQAQIAANVKSGSVSTVKRKKKRTIALPDDGETTTISSTLSTEEPKAQCGSNEKKKKEQNIDKTRALLQRCYREVRTLRDKFELGAYDVNLSRMVTIVDSLWSDFEHSEVLLLTTALFTLVETVEKVVNQTKRRDRLVCLTSVLGVVLSSSKLQLTTRRKIMVEEYANNCRQSLEHLHCSAESVVDPPATINGTEQAAAQRPIPAITSNPAPKAKGTASSEVWPKSHVRFG
ncbi:unnamed protein product [Peronospora farinosa]|uniref:Uncharacterized protein n=1 Tax=Peronospora farinosa TaxID=134698 RepID=A0AAV0T4C3_9STRA|nr:unnamed protein product [Peronospora farinosa]CAI5714493.1 unnamed protein product [Peronospora farinosa]